MTSAEPQVPEPSYAERVRTLVYRNNVGTLSTISRKHPDWPFGSLMPYALDEKGSPVLLISTMAMHTQNLMGDSRASLFISQTDSGGDPLDASRVTLMGEVAKVAKGKDSGVRELYLSRYENARYWVDFDDFSFYKMDVGDIYFVGEYGAMGWVTAEDYYSAEPDPLADGASGIIGHMNRDHEEALILLGSTILGIDADRAVLTSVDRLGFQVRLKSKQAGEYYSRRIAFIREVRTPEEARVVLVEMVKLARASADKS